MAPPTIPPPLRLTDLGLIACALSLGASLQRVDDEGQRIAFYITNAPPDLLGSIERGECQVPARELVRWLNDLASLVRAKQQARRGLQGRQR